MNHLLERLALVAAAGAALAAALAGAWREIPVLPLALRAAVSGLTVYVFVRVGGGLAGRSLLRGLVEDEIERQEAPPSTAAAREEDPGTRRAA